MDNVFIDTNLPVYAVDDDEPLKQRRANEVMGTLVKTAVPVISTQVLQEFYNISVAKLNIEPFVAKNLVHKLQRLNIVQVTPLLIENGIDISISSKISFWDGLIIAAAEYADCPVILSEDLNDGQIINGVRIIDPFKNRLPREILQGRP